MLSIYRKINPRTRQLIWQCLKWGLCILVLGYVSQRAWSLWNSDDASVSSLNISYPHLMFWCVVSGVAYALSWAPSVWFWGRLIHRMGDKVSWLLITRAYFCGHLGKYLPGKALVVIIRGQMIHAAGGNMRSAVVTVFYETLAMMGTGLAVSIALLPVLFPSEVEGRVPAWLHSLLEQTHLLDLLRVPYLALGATVVACLIALPLLSRIMTRIAAKAAPASVEGDSPVPPVDTRMLGGSMVTFLFAWLMQGISLWAVLVGLGASAAINDMILWTEISAISTVGGFLAIFSPGGVGVREGLLLELLTQQPGVGERIGIVAAVLTRLVWLMTEVTLAGLLYTLVRPQSKLADDATTAKPSNTDVTPTDLPKDQACTTPTIATAALAISPS
ncbi:hypothetical protein V22_05830 [Calycomorphotria hydatis]|uniref:Flippase-like domain-containing protein n=1 Tax=Calycomorphotria hydatis TaxID=2528027 RepID=A0A517T4Q3_9PLAN|nr:hypothetical protein V22_05830 [Calycomorphotria hydatis]